MTMCLDVCSTQVLANESQKISAITCINLTKCYGFT